MTDVFGGVVLYETAEAEIQRLSHSLRVASTRCGAEAPLLAIDNSASVGQPYPADPAGCILGVASQGNIGFGRAHNILMKEAFDNGASAYVALNPDGFLHPKALGAMLDVLSRSDRLTLVEARQFPMEHPKVYDPETQITPWCSGACMMISREVYEQTGGFDDGFFMYCEDVDLSWRVRLAGGVCITAANAFFFHDVIDRPQSSFSRWHMALSARRLLSKWGGAEHAKFERHVNGILKSVPSSEIDRGSKVGEHYVSHSSPYKSPADFSNLFGFAEFRWI